MAYVIQCVDMAGTVIDDHGESPDGLFLMAFDVDAHEGRGFVEWTADVGHAMVFDSSFDALQAWRTQSKVMPLREDGQPNRPLTAFTVAYLPVSMVET